MNKKLWNNLAKPILALAPMADVTDAAFRRMFAKYGKPDVMYTEFVSVDGLLSKGKQRLMVDLQFTEGERPIVAQVFGAVPDHFEQVAAMIADLGFDGIDINMGCPDKSVEKQGGGASLINNPKLAVEIIRATKRGAPQLPVSVKTRIGYKTNQLAEWLPVLLGEDLAALTVHLRTRKEMSDVPAHWELASDIAGLRDKYAPQTLVLGNGDVASLEDARVKCAGSGIDGVMIGRAAFGKPWFFSKQQPLLAERLRIMIEHAELFESLYQSNMSKTAGRLKKFETMKKHFKAYANEFDGAKELRIRLMDTDNAAQVRFIIEDFISNAGSIA